MTMIINNVAYQRGRRLGDISIDDISNVVNSARRLSGSACINQMTRC
jgi:hypothetical protein